MALADARKGIDMYRNEKVNVPILGLVENMAWFTPKELPENKYYIFGKGGVKQLAEEMQVPLLGEIPLVQVSAKAATKANRQRFIATPSLDWPSALWLKQCQGNGTPQPRTATNAHR